MVFNLFVKMKLFLPRQDLQSLIKDFNLGGDMNVLSPFDHYKRQKILQANWSFVFHFMFTLDKYALL